MCILRLSVQVDTDSDGYIGGAEGAVFIRRARLLNDANREVRCQYLLLKGIV